MTEKEKFAQVYEAYQKANWIDGGYRGKTQYAYEVIDNKLIILFQCSHGWYDWLCNLIFFPRKVTPYKNMEYEFKVHAGFWREFDGVRDTILKNVEAFFKTKQINEIVIYGWSLGSSLGFYCKEMLSFHFPNFNISCISIGGPRAFCKTDNWEQIKSRFNNTTRYYNKNDIVTKLPFKILGFFTPFKHICEGVQVGDSFSLFKVFKPNKYHLDSEYYKEIMK